MKIAFYGRLADTLGPELDLEAPGGCSIADLRRQVSTEYPETAATLTNRRALACVGGTLVRDDYVVAAGDRIEFLPPVSGG
jgi:molybdopterin converting factor small subunit